MAARRASSSAEPVDTDGVAFAGVGDPCVKKQRCQHSDSLRNQLHDSPLDRFYRRI